MNYNKPKEARIKKIKEGFVLRKVSEAYVVIAVGEAAKNFGGMITLNSTGAFLWEKLSQGCETKKQLVDALLEEYDVAGEIASADVDKFVEKLEKASLIEN